MFRLHISDTIALKRMLRLPLRRGSIYKVESCRICTYVNSCNSSNEQCNCVSMHFQITHSSDQPTTCNINTVSSYSLSQLQNKTCLHTAHSIQHYIDLWCYLICFYCIFSSGRGNTLKQLQCFCLCQVIQSARMGFYIHRDLENSICACLIQSCYRHQNTNGQRTTSSKYVYKGNIVLFESSFPQEHFYKVLLLYRSTLLLACASNNVLESCEGLLSTFFRSIILTMVDYRLWASRETWVNLNISSKVLNQSY